MKKILVLVLAVLVGIAIAKEAKAQDTEKQSLLWKISGNGLDKPSYLYGTIHMICPDDFSVDKKIKKAFKGTKITVLELDMDAPSFMKDMQMSSLNKGMANISDQLSEADLKLLNNYFTKNYGMSMKQLGIMKPFLLSSMVVMKMLSCEKPKSYEEEFVAMSEKKKREVIGLETIEFQTSIFDDQPMEEQLASLVKAVKEKDKGLEVFEEMLTAYKANDLSGLYQAMKADPEFAKQVDVMLNQRNANWIPQLEKTMKEQPAFVAVGAGHLVGEKGLVALLRAQGYTVTPIVY